MLLSHQAHVLWAKTSDERDNTAWLPLCIHMADSAEVAKLLWDEWLPRGTKNLIVKTLIENGVSAEVAENKARQLYVFLAAAHDVGKASPTFQESERAVRGNPSLLERVRKAWEKAGLEFQSRFSNLLSGPHHTLVSYEVLRRNKIDKSFAAIVGGHHGKPPTTMDIRVFDNISVRVNAGFEDSVWIGVQDELLQYALELSGITASFLEESRLDKPAQVILTGLVIMADWIASDADRFPLVRENERPACSQQRAREAWEDFEFPQPWDPPSDWRTQDLYEKRFDFNAPPRPIQQAVVDVLRSTEEVGMMIIEAQTGEGKTEAAQVAAEILAEMRGCGGAYFALPTQATSDGLFLRVYNWLRTFDGEHSVFLAHGKAQFNDDYQNIARKSMVGGYDPGESVDENLVVHDWFQGRKKGILSDFVVGTIDQVLMGGLRQKHLALRHVALANKVVILDECHAYDAYMSEYLYLVLRWLGAYGVPVVVLSATLPADKRKALFEAYLNTIPRSTQPAWLKATPGDNEEAPSEQDAGHTYPLLTYTDNRKVKSREVDASSDRELNVGIEYLSDDLIVPRLEALLSGGGCAGLIFNTVNRAQDFAKLLMEHFDKEGDKVVRLLHSRFITPDRIRREREVRDKLGWPGDRPDRMIVVGTQVLEQSLDIDFDVLITDICPMDLLIQRIGRLHRHKRSKRPEGLSTPHCFVTGVGGDDGFERGSLKVYGKYTLINTKELLPSRIIIPDDVPLLVQNAYKSEGLEVSDEFKSEYRQAKKESDAKVSNMQSRAEGFQISGPRGGSETLIGWLDMEKPDASGKRGEATVRDANDSVEVLVVQRCGEGIFRTLPWLEELSGRRISLDRAPDDALAKVIAKCTVSLPSMMCWPGTVDRVITSFERDNIEKHSLEAWQTSPWLHGELFLVLDKQLDAKVGVFKLHYSKEFGLSAERVRDDDER